MKSIARVIVGFALFLGAVFFWSSPSGGAGAPSKCRGAGATLSITGKGFGPFKSTRYNQVIFQGAPALIQRWEPDIIEVRVPSQATNGPVEVITGKKHVKQGHSLACSRRFNP